MMAARSIRSRPAALVAGVALWLPAATARAQDETTTDPDEGSHEGGPLDVVEAAKGARGYPQATWWAETTGVGTFGLLFTPVFTGPKAMAAGAEVTVVGYPGDGKVGVGLFGQAQTYSLDHGRYAGGLQVNYSALGVELGFARRMGSDGYAATNALQVGPFVSVGLVSLSLRLAIPVNEPAGPSPGYGTEVGVSIAFKLPIPIGKEPQIMRLPAPGGRPLVVDDAARVALVVRHGGWADYMRARSSMMPSSRRCPVSRLREILLSIAVSTT